MGIKEMELIKASKQIIRAVGEGLMSTIDMDESITLPIPLTNNELCVRVYTQVRGNQRYLRCEKYEALFRRIEEREEARTENLKEGV